MTMTGVDYAWGRPGGAALAAAGVQFAMRYASMDPSKNLAKAEALDLAEHGISVGIVWETTERRAMDGYAAGISDAAACLAQANAAGRPADRGVFYAAVDFDVQDDELGTVCEYFAGWNTVIPADMTGVYGGVKVVDHIIGQLRAQFGWQTTAWSGGLWSEHAVLRQDGGTQYINGVECDLNTALNAAIGTWYPAGFSPAPAPEPQYPPFPGRELQLQRPDMTGEDVQTWQQRMSDRGWPITVDGWYGDQSATICREFQNDSTQHGWPLTVDGIVGPKTWDAAWERPIS